MKKIMILSAFVAGLLLVSCNKDQSAVKKLDGSWKMVEQDGDAIPAEAQNTYNFTSCKLKNDEYCPASLTYPDQTVENFEYKVTGDGEMMTWKTDDGQGNVLEMPGTIDELTKTNMTITFTLLGNTVVKFEKQ